MTMRALEAVEKLRADNISVAVMHVPTIAYSDEKRLLSRRRSPSLGDDRENHTGRWVREAVAALLMRKGVRVVSWIPLACSGRIFMAGALPTLHEIATASPP